MVGFLAWLDQNWFTLVQSIGIVGSLWITAATVRRDRKARKVGDALALAGLHRELWSEAHRRPELRRILLHEVDLVAQPISEAEEEYLNLVFVHFQTGWQLAKENWVNSLEVLAADVRWFFTLPLPSAMWRRTKPSRDAAFVRFIDRALARPKED